MEGSGLKPERCNFGVPRTGHKNGVPDAGPKGIGIMDQSTPRTEASAPNRLNLQTIPGEVQNQITSLLPSTVLRDLYGMLRFTLSSQEDNHSRVWKSIFKKDDGLKTVTFDYRIIWRIAVHAKCAAERRRAPAMSITPVTGRRYRLKNQ
jgi:hypothetical protein